MEKRDFFISYTKTDVAWAALIANLLESAGYSYFFQLADISAGDDIIDKMNEFLEKSRFFLAIWSKNYCENSKYGKQEFNAAHNLAFQGRMNGVLIFQVDDYPPIEKALSCNRVYLNLYAITIQNSFSYKVLKFAIMDAVRGMAGAPSKAGGGSVEEPERTAQPDTNASAVTAPPVAAPSVSRRPKGDSPICGDFEVTHTIGKTEADYNLLLLGGNCHIGFGKDVLLQWGDGPAISKHMHNKQKGRIDGLAEIYRDNGIELGATLRVRYDSAKRLLTLERA